MGIGVFSLVFFALCCGYGAVDLHAGHSAKASGLLQVKREDAAYFLLS
jgi:hypothetical protein